MIPALYSWGVIKPMGPKKRTRRIHEYCTYNLIFPPGARIPTIYLVYYTAYIASVDIAL